MKTAAVRAGIGGDRRHPCHVATTCPHGQPGLPSVRLTGGPYHADWTVPRQDVNSSFSPLRVPPKQPRCLHTHRFGTLCGQPNCNDSSMCILGLQCGPHDALVEIIQLSVLWMRQIPLCNHISSSSLLQMQPIVVPVARNSLCFFFYKA